MKYFRLIAKVDVRPLLEEVEQQEEAWLFDTSRQDKTVVQKDTNTIFIRSALRRPDLNVNENQESSFTNIAKRFPAIAGFLLDFAKKMDADLSRATIVRLKPKSQVYPHVDVGSYYFVRDRYHLVLHSTAGSVLKSGDEEVRMKEGELWWFNNKQYHEAFNESDEWRIHCIFDLLPKSFKSMAVNPMLLTFGEVTQNLPIQAQSSTARHEQVFRAIRDHAILRSKDQRLISPNGKMNSWLIDMRRIFMDAKLLDTIAEMFWQEFKNKMPFQVGGMEVAAIPLLTAILMKSAAYGVPINGFIVRKERKTYGTGSLLEGKLTDDPIIIVDDIINSASSLEKIRAILESEGKKISAVFVLIDYHRRRGEQWRRQHQISVIAPFTADDFGVTFEAKEEPDIKPIFRTVWRFVSPDPNFFHRVPKSSPATDGKSIYFGSDSGFFWCLDAQTGNEKWHFKVSSRGHKNIWSAPALLDRRVFFGAYDGNVYCLNAGNGQEVWRFSDADWVGSSPVLAPELNLLFIGLEFAIEGRKGSIVALNLQTGEKVWEHPTKRFTHASPAYWPERQLVACGSNDDEMFLFEAKTGKLLWRFQTKADGVKGSIRHAPAFDKRRAHLITGCADGYIYIIDIETGQEVWSVKTDNTIYSIPLVVEDLAYLGSTDKYMYILDLEKREVREKIYVGSKIYSPPSYLQEKIYFGACNGLVYEINPVSAKITGAHQLPDGVTNKMTYSADTKMFYALTYTNQLYALAQL